MCSMYSATIVEFDGTDTTGKTTVACAVAQALRGRGIGSVVVPSARVLVPGFMERMQALSAVSLIDHELAGYGARLAWAEQRSERVCLIDRGIATLLASSVARLVMAGFDEEGACALVAHRLGKWRNDLQGEVWASRRYLLCYDRLSEEQALACFLEREEQAVSAQYLAYQRCFLGVMRGWGTGRGGIWGGDWDGVLDATKSVGVNRRAVAADLMVGFTTNSQVVELV